MTIQIHDDFERSSVNATLSEVTTDTDSVPLVRLKVRQQTFAGGLGTWLEPVAKITGVNGLQPRFEFFPYRSTPTAGYNTQVWASAQRAHYSYDFETWHPIATADLSVTDVLKVRHDTPFAQDTVYIARSWPVSVSGTGNWILGLQSAHPTKIKPTPSAVAHTPVTTTSFPAQSFICADIDAATNELGQPIPATPLYSFMIDDDAFGAKPETAVIGGGIHPSEDVGLVAMREFVAWLLGASPEAAAMRQRYRILCYPVLNPAAKYAGYYRVAPGGNVDSGSQWRSTTPVYDFVPKAKAAIHADSPGAARWLIDFHATVNTNARWMFTQVSNLPETLYLRAAVNNRLPEGVAPVGVYGSILTVDVETRTSFSTGFAFRARDHVYGGLGVTVGLTAETTDVYGPISPSVMQPYAEALGLGLYDRTMEWLGEQPIPGTPPPGSAMLVAPSGSHQIIRPTVKTAEQWNGSLFESYGSGVFNPYYSSVGAYVMTGCGGHNHQETFGAAVWDWSDRSWKWHDCVQMPERNTPVQLEETNDEPWMEMLGTEVPAPTHPFRTLTVVPPALGGGPQGDMMYYGRGSTANSWDPTGQDPVSWSYASKTVHRFSFETGEWSRAMPTPIPWLGKNAMIEGNTVFDPVMSRWYAVSDIDAYPELYYLNGNTWEFGITPKYPIPPRVDQEINYEAATYGASGGRRYILHAHSYLLRLLDLDDIATGWRTLDYTGIMPTVHGSGATERDVGTQNAWVFHEAQGVFYLRMHNWANQRLFRLTPPVGDPRTGTWHVTQIQMAGDVIPEYAGPPAPENKGSRCLHYIPSLQMLGWVTKHGVALINPTKSQPGNQPSAIDRPVCTVRPAVSGPPVLGQTVTCDTGTWINNPTSFSYQWIRAQTVVGTDASYTIQAADLVGDRRLLRCIVSATNSNGTEALASMPFLATEATTGKRITFVARIEVVSPSPLPSWRQGQAVGEWREIPNTSMSLFPPSVNPGRAAGGPHNKLNTWCGLAIDTRSSTVWSLANGGHNDYHGNEVMRLDLSSGAPGWVEVLPSSKAEDFVIPNNSARYTDGRPASIHSYYSQQFIERRNRAFRFGAPAIASSGESRPDIDAFDVSVAIGVNGWDPEGAYPKFPVMTPNVPVCKDPHTEDVYAFDRNYSVFKWTEATNKVSTVNVGFPPNMQRACSAFDSTRNRILLMSASGAWTFDPSTGTFTTRTISGPYAATVIANGRALIYSPVLDKFLFRGTGPGGDVIVIDPATFTTSLLPVTNGAFVDGTIGDGESADPSARWPYTRFLYAPALGGVVWIGHYNANAWFLRTE